MKLYATTTSERASKGQGGNNHIRIDLNVGSTNKSRKVATVTLIALQNGGYEIFYYNIDEDKKSICLQTGEISKGKQKKDEVCLHNYCNDERQCNACGKQL